MRLLLVELRASVWQTLLFLCVITAVGATLPANAQEGEEEDVAPPPPISTGVGHIEFRGRQIETPYAVGYRGVLVGLAQTAELLGGTYQIGPLRQSHTLRIGEDEMVVGADGNMMIRGDKLIPLSQQPLRHETGLLVPLDMLRKTYGDMFGYRFEWLESERRLFVGQASGDVLPVRIDWVSDSAIGGTTLVLRFPRRPRYQVDFSSNPVLIKMLGERLGGQPPRRVEDPLVERVVLREGSVAIYLDEDAVSAEPYELDKGSQFEIVFDISRRAPGAPRVTGRSPLEEGAADPTDAGSVDVSDAPRQFVPPPRKEGYRIVIDPGHGGPESGAVGKGGNQEKRLTLLLARSLKGALERRMSVRVVLTRQDDSDVSLEARTALANQNQADLFISIHLNAEPWGQGAKGAETYFLSSEASDERAAFSAQFENRDGSGRGGGESEDALGLMLWDLAQNRHLSESQRLAKLVQQELNDTLGITNRGVKQAPFRVLMGASMPAVLIELGFLSNPEEEKKLADAGYRQELVDSLVRAIGRFRASAGDG